MKVPMLLLLPLLLTQTAKSASVESECTMGTGTLGALLQWYRGELNPIRMSDQSRFYCALSTAGGHIGAVLGYSLGWAIPFGLQRDKKLLTIGAGALGAVLGSVAGGEAGSWLTRLCINAWTVGGRSDQCSNFDELDQEGDIKLCYEAFGQSSENISLRKMRKSYLLYSKACHPDSRGPDLIHQKRMVAINLCYERFKSGERSKKKTNSEHKRKEQKPKRKRKKTNSEHKRKEQKHKRRSKNFRNSQTWQDWFRLHKEKLSRLLTSFILCGSTGVCIF